MEIIIAIDTAAMSFSTTTTEMIISSSTTAAEMITYLSMMAVGMTTFSSTITAAMNMFLFMITAIAVSVSLSRMIEDRNFSTVNSN